MDQIRAFIKFVWRERFWVLSVVGTVVAAVCWQLSSTSLDAQFGKRKNEISGAFKNMNSLTSQAVHPNDDVNKGDRAQLVVQRNIVLDVWNKLYDRQREEVLYWPNNLKASFIKEIDQLEFGDPFPAHSAGNMVSHYRNYIKTRFDGLLEIPKALKMEGGRGGARFRGGGDVEGGEGRGARGAPRDEEEEEDYLVQWVDQNDLREKLEFNSKPTYMQIWVTQEDLWVYETLLNVIAKTNQERGATRPDNTAVRMIVALQVGRNAAAANQEKASLVMPSAGGGGGMGGEGGYGEGMYGGRGEEGMGGEGMYDRGEGMGMGGEGMYGGRGGMGEGGTMDDATVLANRYLDAEGEPYAGEPEDSEFRRLPIRMRLMMDQRWIPQVLIECANAALPVEVTQLRVNPEKSGGAFGSASGRSGGSSRPRGISGMDSLEDDPNIASVEIRGIVYIYNKPDETVLDVPGMDEDQLADAAANVQR